jgi:hypothetical protein
MFKRAMFGIKPMTAVYQRVADAVLNALDYAVAYIDDNIVSGENRWPRLRLRWTNIGLSG